MNININLYVTALYEAAKENNPLEYLDQIDDFVKLLNSDDEISKFLLTTYNQFDVVVDVLSESFTKQFINFLRILYEDRFLKKIVEIQNLYAKTLMEKKHLSIVDIYSKDPLSEEAIKQIINMLEKKYPKPFRMSQNIDESLIGGYILKVNGDIYDTSFKSKLSKIQKLGGVINE